MPLYVGLRCAVSGFVRNALSVQELKRLREPVLACMPGGADCVLQHPGWKLRQHLLQRDHRHRGGPPAH